ncbi:GNAT family N-acetyltransferase [Bacillus suaedaesalsae]|uniref:GNAT family N-acetyltransferase n=1 Tax=Bacillus suaedaesalsae TaxID=2810349 RepID=A0ABS2DMY6_9BACI|nr:GNAT family N-acetyltransferase [Bacillus suaedaesalsae]MBM6618838.1 GNAT family N-acetyltransferase [Bacillus suaedaesalsae]
MSIITIQSINKGNWEEAIQLSVKEEQKSFVASNLYSIAEVQFLENFYAKGIYLDNIMVGFAMYGIDPDDQNFWISRLMVDEVYQGKGIGMEAIKLIIDDIKSINRYEIPYIMIGYNQSNEYARNAYKKAGFVESEIAPWGEQLARYKL